MRTFASGVLAAVVLTAAVGSARADEPKKAPVLNFKMKSIDGEEVDLSKYQGKVVMIVNVASKCGYTKQYNGLQKLNDKYAKDGLVIIGVPANEFLKQEPGSDKEIAAFCKAEYGVTFPMMSKVVVKGRGITPLYKHLTSKETNPKFSGPIGWNFTKFLIARDGTIVKRFEPRVDPLSAEVVKSVEAELKKKAS